ncbi:hypothetical protein [Parashewanella tropica]|uniref:hypothetical protein n=1 Tax=Parashewanella tropica TaxID=2547970 RepID=UPI00147806C1|nr:hypothetical protein [Parashewanella tropica]
MASASSWVMVNGFDNTCFVSGGKVKDSINNTEQAFNNCFKDDPMTAVLWVKFTEQVSAFVDKYPGEEEQTYCHLSEVNTSLSKTNDLQGLHAKRELLVQLISTIVELQASELSESDIPKFHRAFLDFTEHLEAETRLSKDSPEKTASILQSKPNDGIFQIVIAIKAQETAIDLVGEQIALDLEKTIEIAICHRCWILASYCFTRSGYKAFQMFAEPKRQEDFDNHILFTLVTHYDSSASALEFTKTLIEHLPKEYITKKNPFGSSLVGRSSSMDDLNVFKEMVARAPEELYSLDCYGVPFLHSLVKKGANVGRFFKAITEVEQRIQQPWLASTETVRFQWQTYSQVGGQQRFERSGSAFEEIVSVGSSACDNKEEKVGRGERVVAVKTAPPFKVNWHLLTPDGDSILHHALHTQKMEALCAILKLPNFPIDMKNGLGDTVLHTAVRECKITEAANIMGFDGLGKHSGKCRDTDLKHKLCEAKNIKGQTVVELMRALKRQSLLDLVKK